MATSITTPPLDTTKVEGRRKVRYASYDDLVADAERLAAGEVRTLGNWSYGQVLDHLARSIHAMIDGPGFKMSMPMRFVMRLLMMKKMVHQELSPGFKFPANVAARFCPPDDAAVEPSLEALRQAIARVKSTDQRALHPAFGTIKTSEWDQFQLRHCEMHMSFVQTV